MRTYHDRKCKTFKACIIANMTQKYSTYLFMYSCSINKGVGHQGPDVSVLCVLSLKLNDPFVLSSSYSSSGMFSSMNSSRLIFFESEHDSLFHAQRLSTPSSFSSSLVLIVIMPAYKKMLC